MAGLTTHVLDTAQGCPAAGVEVTLFHFTSEFQQIRQDSTNSDGRLDSPLLSAQDIKPGIYQLVFKAGNYFRKSKLELPEILFVDEVVLRFGIAEADQHYHVPLLVSPWSYSTYRGS